MTDKVKFTSRDERTITIPVPANGDELARFSQLLNDAANAGYTLVGATEIDGGSQRDPYTVGLRVDLSRGPS